MKHAGVASPTSGVIHREYEDNLLSVFVGVIEEIMGLWWMLVQRCCPNSLPYGLAQAIYVMSLHREVLLLSL